jgi:hypothetical protein
MKGDNFKVEVRSSGEEHFNIAFNLAMSSAAGGKAVSYKVTDKSGLILYWHESATGSSPLPYPMEVNAARHFAWNWLSQAEFPPEPDQDGSNERGFIVGTGDFWGHVEESFYSIVFIKPDWQMYGK